MLTYKTKEAFEKWLVNENYFVQHSIGTIDAFQIGRNIFYKLPFSMQYGIYVDFFDDSEIYIDIYTESNGDYFVSVHKKYFNNDKTALIRDKLGFIKNFKTRSKARKNAILKANNLFNNL